MSEVVIICRRGFSRVLAAANEQLASRWRQWHPEMAEPMPAEPRLVLVCCDHPDAFRSLSQILPTQFPLSEILIVAGPWLRAFGRSRTHWPASWLVSEAEAIGRLEAIGRGEPVEPHPLTWTRDERIMAESKLCKYA